MEEDQTNHCTSWLSLLRRFETLRCYCEALIRYAFASVVSSVGYNNRSWMRLRCYTTILDKKRRSPRASSVRKHQHQHQHQHQHHHQNQRFSVIANEFSWHLLMAIIGWAESLIVGNIPPICNVLRSLISLHQKLSFLSSTTTSTSTNAKQKANFDNPQRISESSIRLALNRIILISSRIVHKQPPAPKWILKRENAAETRVWPLKKLEGGKTS